MSIIIKGLKMPKNCWECAVQGNPVCIECLDFSTRRERPTGCPLVEVPDGHWIHETGKIPKCSVCGKYSDDADTGDAKSCPFCGARMDGE